MANSMEGQETIHSVCGPLCHSMKDMKLFMTSVLAEKPWLYDSKVIPMPWRQSEEDAIKLKLSSGGLTLGFYTCDGNVWSFLLSVHHEQRLTNLGSSSSARRTCRADSCQQGAEGWAHGCSLEAIQAPVCRRFGE